MTRHRRHGRTRKKSQRGGAWYNPFGSSEESTMPSTNQGSGMFSDALSSVTGATSNLVSGSESYLQGAKEKSSSWFSGISNPFSSSSQAATVEVEPVENTSSYNATGGRRRSRKMRRRRMRGGKGGLGLTYYATNVSDIKMAEPTNWIKGGSRRRRTRRHKRH